MVDSEVFCRIVSQLWLQCSEFHPPLHPLEEILFPFPSPFYYYGAHGDGKEKKKGKRKKKKQERNRYF